MTHHCSRSSLGYRPPAPEAIQPWGPQHLEAPAWPAVTQTVGLT
jgi:hypothetical protein